MNAHLALLPALALTIASASAFGATHINRYDAKGALIESIVVPLTPEEVYTLVVDARDATIYVYDDNGVAGSIPHLILVQHEGKANPIHLIIAQESYNPDDVEFAPEDMAASVWFGLETERPGVTVSAHVRTIGERSVIASHIRRLEVRSLQAPVTQGLSPTDPFSAGKGLVIIAEDDIYSTVHAAAGYIERVAARDIRAEVIAASPKQDGYIVDIIAQNNVGRSTPPTTVIRAARANPKTGKHIRQIIAGGSLNADISTTDPESPHAAVGTIEAGWDWSTWGTTAQETFLSSFESIRIGAEFRAVVDLSEPIREDQTIAVGTHFGGTITVPPEGLRGQVVIGARPPHPWYWWGGGIVVGDTTLENLYDADPSSIGGGAAGVVPFAMHESTASPPNRSAHAVRGLETTGLRVECVDSPFNAPVSFSLYGPANLTKGVGEHAAVERWDGAAWSDAGFDLHARVLPGSGDRALEFVHLNASGDASPWPVGVGRYRIVPREGRIVCAGVEGAPTVAFEYTISLKDACANSLLSSFDLNLDNTLCAQDIAHWVSNPVDLNNDSVADGDDIALLINAVNTYNN